jgi:Collagen triple helix repeat (20 copies)
MRQGSVQTLILALAMLPVAAFSQVLPLAQDSYFTPAVGINYGTATTLNVGGPNASQAVVQFDLSTLPAGATSSNVAGAILSLFASKVGAAGTVNISVANGPWMETVLTGTSAYPVPAAAVASGVSVGSANQYIYVDATAAVRNWLNGSTNNNGFIITAAGGGVNVAFDSKESATTSHPATLTVALMSMGPIGPTGPQGAIGTTGPVGATGAQGVIGPTGAAGAAGAKGATGATGGQGVIGPTGAKGTTGGQGSVGPVGPTGPASASGLFTEIRNDFSLPGSNYVLLSAYCTVDHPVLVSGGCGHRDYNNASLDIVIHYNGPDTGGGNFWSCNIDNNSNDSRAVLTYAICSR